ncbi:MAG: nucleotidyl transferase AbiEii/AbiGii toxin family protein [Planctomycetes bacterium]|nr:nucleotidyl transferase AbiEii/AbiGii toxin family protein [Planctomycetota bacterium]
MNDPLPLGKIQQAVLDFLEGRDDAALFGAMAVNAYVDERRMTEDVDIVSTRAKDLAEELRQHLNELFSIAIRLRTVGDEAGFRLYQIVKPKNRHLVDLRPVDELPPTERVDGVLVVNPAEVIASKVVACCERKGRPKSFTDRRDLAVLLLTFPDLKSETGSVQDRLATKKNTPEIVALWQELVAEEIPADHEDDEFH